MATKRFIVYGAGAVGGSLGGLLHRAGHEVVLIARGPHLDAIRADGLRLVTGDGAESLPIEAVASPAELDSAPGDVVLLAMKSMNTEAALRDLAAVVDPATPIVCVQNGVANERAALRLFPNVYGVCVMFPSTHLEPGVVEPYAWPVPAILDLGRYPAGVDETAESIAAAFRSAGCQSEPRADVMRWKYHKLLMNLGNAIDATVQPGDGVAELLELAQAEGMKVLDAAGIPFVSPAEDRARRGDILKIDSARRSGSSSWQSLARGTGTIETDYLNGEIVLLGRLHGVPTPVNERIHLLANSFARDGRAPGSLAANDLLAALDRPVL
ncbi:ketopantoate reductase family protein [Nocardia colli]|uniref:2-dehydropantoate 2-reductase n=1 Tax=Nocardia colli TaxID=2545717 RepID=A0A5N0EII7_9NOCA|nr:ketopantoate reductase family protein [Nocardia colli]KAA8887191.1 ketopantoate reductase family protein [Nocardia colli]